MLWVAAALLVSATSVQAADYFEELNKNDKSKGLIQSLRRQLMQDNSDYSHEVSKNPEIHRRADPELDKPQEKLTGNYYVTEANQHSQDGNGYTIIEDIVEQEDGKKKPEHPVYEKDLYYYADDDKVIKKEPENRKYESLKVRHQFRRSGQNKYIKEEGDEGVAIVSLNKAPFPELRLPSSRRQYKHDHGEAVTEEEEIPPPPVNDDNPEGGDIVTL